jgi:P-type Cu+ transporter
LATKQNTCYHCGDPCDEHIYLEDKPFCCTGCKQVYMLLQENGLCTYYDLQSSPGIRSMGNFTGSRFAYLDDETVIGKLLSFKSQHLANITLQLPQIHCSSCVFLLENLHRIQQGVISSRINFNQKEIFISFDPSVISLRKIIEILSFIGYEPSLSLHDSDEHGEEAKIKTSLNVFKKNQILRIGIAGFSFANIMMLSFPDYFSSGNLESGLKAIFTWLNFALSLPVLIISANGIFLSAWKGLRQRFINIDVPIALAIVITFARSYYEIITGYGSGYLDSGTGIIFFMLVGRWFQDKTYDALSFERDYRSYFPLSTTILDAGTIEINGNRQERNIPVSKLVKGNVLVIRHGEMIPADAELISGDASIDYSFVNGETIPVMKHPGELIYAGGKQTGGRIELKVRREPSQSYITTLWNNDIFKTGKHRQHSFIHPWSRYFTLALFAIATASVVFWAFSNPVNIMPSLISVLIVACPCSLLLSATFTNGNMVRNLGRNKLYLKNSGVIESLANIDVIVFDKTGTLTEPDQSVIKYSGHSLNDKEKIMVQSIAAQSSHPVNRLIATFLKKKIEKTSSFKEHAGNGMEAIVNDKLVRLGSSTFIPNSYTITNGNGTVVNLEINKEYKGYFKISNYYREGIHESIASLKNCGYDLHVLSGDNDAELQKLRYMFGESGNFRFATLPADKLAYIKELQGKNKKVLMVGDGLNDAGALMQADVGISVNNDNTVFTPACDAILSGDRVHLLPQFLKYCRMGKKIITASFILSIVYNIIGLSFAVSATLSPLVAAVLMPASSISIVVFVTLAGNIMARKNGL